jgi:hypothetical protein
VNPPNLEKLRRFSLTTALILITYVSAGLNINPSQAVALFGVPITIRRPNLIIVGVMIAAAYGTIRYVYYAFFHRRSPRKCRKRFLSKFEPTQQPGVYRAKLAFTTNEIEILKGELPGIFPELVNVTPLIPIEGEPKADDRVILFVPPEIRKASWFEDFDYSAPVWLNVIALVLSILSVAGLLSHGQ